MKRPSVLILYTDQQRYDSLGCNGNPQAITPHLDRLASEGVRFENVFVQNPVCMPSRMSFLTGRYCSSLGVGFNGIPLPADAVPLHRLLKPYGYHAGLIGKLHFWPHALRDHRNPYPVDHGFDTFIPTDESGCYDDAYLKWVEAKEPAMVDRVRTSPPPAALLAGRKSLSPHERAMHKPYLFDADESLSHASFVAAETCRYLEARARSGEPFVAIAGFLAPHPPLNPPKRFVEMYDPTQLPLPRVGPDETAAPELAGVTPQMWKEIAAYYLACVSHVDDCVGTIAAKLRELGLEDDTIVVFTSDHGEYLGDHGRTNKSMPGHDCIARVPFILRYPALLAGGRASSELIEAVDVAPTLLDLCAVQTPSFMQGRSFAPLLAGRPYTPRDDTFIEAFVPGGLRQATVRTKEHKYYCNSAGRELMYDLRRDPHELRDVAADSEYAGVLSAMRKRLIVRMQLAAGNGTGRVAEY
ncbi:MAG: sulfatase-like hydrolase/transferase [Paenibacillaceae bacterium]|nr:sulfatase-like hydrolase/transferase [Paenibacillaceae bacterium]